MGPNVFPYATTVMTPPQRRISYTDQHERREIMCPENKKTLQKRVINEGVYPRNFFFSTVVMGVEAD
jgi:hypothetical protein